MSLPAESQPWIRFGEFLLDCESAELRRNGDKASLQGQPLQILTMLVEKPGRMVTREELKKRLWPSDTFVDFDQSLNRAVNRLREALGDSAEHPRFIETLPRRGYRFIAPVERDGAKPAIHPQQSYQWPTNNEAPSADLESASVPAPAAAVPRARWNRRLVAGSIIFVVVLLAAGWFLLRRFLVTNRGISFDNLEMTKLTDNGKVKNVAISPDGRYVAYAVFLGEKQELRLRQVATRSDIQILPPDLGNFVGLSFSPDGNYIYFVRSDSKDLSFRYLYSIPTLGGTPRKLITDVDSGVSFSPDGRHIAYEHWFPPRNEAELKIANADGTGERVLAVIHNASFVSFGGPGPSWSPDGRTIVFSKFLLEKQQRWVLYSVSVGNGKTHELYSSSTGIGRPVWLPGGKALLLPRYEPNLNRNQLWTVSFPQGVARRLTHDISDYSEDLSLTSDGAMIASTMSIAQSGIWAFQPAEFVKGQQLTSGQPALFRVKETINGRLLSLGEDGRLWIMNPDGTERTIFGSSSNVGWFTPCGEFVVLMSEGQGSTTLKRLNLDGTHPIDLARGNLWSPTCSADNGHVYYVNFEQPEKIWRVPMNGGTAVEVASILGDTIGSSLSLSPDGNSLAYIFSTYYGVTSPGEHLAVVNASDGKTTKLFDVMGNTWSPVFWTLDGRALQLLRSEDDVTNIWEQPLAGGKPRQLTHFTSGHIFDFTWSTDRTRLFVTRGTVTSDAVLLTGLR
jgi:eukaryotic-like serine/threonine-protein kinase